MFCIEHRFFNVCGKCLNQWVTSVNEIDVKPCTTWNSQVRISLEFLESSSVEFFYFLLTNEFSFFIFCGLFGTRTVREIVGSRDSYSRIDYTVKPVQGVGIRLDNFSNFQSWIKTFLRIVQILAVKEGIFIFNFDKSFSNRNTGNPKTSQVQANFWNVQKELTDGTIQLKKFSKGIWKKNASKNRVIFTKWMKLMIIGLFREKNGSFIKNVMKK